MSEPISIGNFFIDEVSFELFKVTVSNHKCTLSDKIGGCIHVTSSDIACLYINICD